MINYEANAYTLGFEGAVNHMGRDLQRDSFPVDTNHWQGLSGTPMSMSQELTNVCLKYPIPSDVGTLQKELSPNLPWAEDHFLERVSRVPHNPPPSYEWWPFNKRGDAFQKDEKFSHTYPERFWPKRANLADRESLYGIRYPYGDLDDLVDLLVAHPGTRQAWLPVWFPEDTGAVHGGRVPCSLGYQFTIRGDRLHCHYVIRSVDFLRHFRDDVYMAARLTQWVGEEIESKADLSFLPGFLYMTMFSLHVFAGDREMMEAKYG